MNELSNVVDLLRRNTLANQPQYQIPQSVDRVFILLRPKPQKLCEVQEFAGRLVGVRRPWRSGERPRVGSAFFQLLLQSGAPDPKGIQIGFKVFFF